AQGRLEEAAVLGAGHIQLGGKTHEAPGVENLLLVDGELLEVEIFLVDLVGQVGDRLLVLRVGRPEDFVKDDGQRHQAEDAEGAGGQVLFAAGHAPPPSASSSGSGGWGAWNMNFGRGGRVVVKSRGFCLATSTCST